MEKYETKAHLRVDELYSFINSFSIGRKPREKCPVFLVDV
jgi:hypothetical protein